MAQYPHAYGQYPGHPPPPHPYAYPNQAAYPPAPSYGSPPDPNAPAPNYYAMTQSAYHYNSSIPGIPGLGIGGTPGAGTPYQPPPMPAWGHQVSMQFAAGTPSAPSQHPYPAPAQFNRPADQVYEPHSSYNTQPLPAKPAPAPHLTNAATQSSDEMEEGELSSDDQFEDLYEPVDSSARSKDTTVAPAVPTVPHESQPASTVDTPCGGFYTNDEGDSDGRNDSVTATGAGASAHTNNLSGVQEPTTARERSGSYSPYLSPREIQLGGTPNTASQSTQGFQKAHINPGRPAANGTGHAVVPGLGQPTNNAPNASTRSHGATNGNSATPNNNRTSMPEFKSLAEARKEAQKAILKLWPFGVRGEHYIDEGIDEKVVKGLFRDLQLDFSTGKPAPPDATPPTQQAPSSGPRSSASATSKSPASERKTLAQPQSGTKPSEGDKMAKSEERKDRIARLLAEKKAAKGAAPAPPALTTQAPTLNTTQLPIPAVAAPGGNAQAQTSMQSTTTAHAPLSAQPQTSVSVQAQPPATSQATVPAVTNPSTTAQSSATSTPTGTKPKTKTKEEIERLLRQKMEALQRSRELSGKKADSDKTSSSSLKSSGGQTVTSQPTTAISVNVPTREASPQVQSSQDKGPIPGLVLPSALQATQPINVRKRPVAADFVDYPAADSLKRPFGQKRQNSSLVIDVSDGSDDEEMDIDMDMDSPDETPLTIQRSNTPGRKGPSLAEYPPLRDLTRRNVSSPSPATQTPPSGFLSTKEKELLAKERAIQEMRRKIAEFEAKKAKKGSQTPNQAAASSSDANDSESSGANVPRASSAAAEKVDAASAQLLSEVVSAKLSKPSESGPKGSSLTGRGRSVSVGASRVNAALEEKKKQLAALREAREAKKREAEERMRAEQARIAEEEARMQEEEARLQAELEQDAEMESGSDDDDQSVRMSVDEGSEDSESAKGDEGEQAEATQATASTQASSSQVQEKQTTPAAPISNEARERERGDPTSIEAQDIHVSGEPRAVIEGAVSLETDHLAMSQDGSDPSVAHGGQHRVTSSQHQAAGVAMHEQVPEIGHPTDSFLDRAGSSEPAGAIANDSLNHVAVPDSPEFSPEPADGPTSDAAGHLAAQAGELAAPATISDVPRSRDDTQEIEGPVKSEPNRAVVAPKPHTSFVPYESPLRYFRAFRFHPEFNKVVPGGVKSLTYSNKIDPKKELCPDELQGQSCPRGKDCEFQHLSSIGVSDEQILVELGKSDDYTGEQRERFIQGLKELLQDFRVRKTRDFDTIANGIIEFRARFLGDRSKILPLGGVTL